jgi:hypothetical protein
MTRLVVALSAMPVSSAFADAGQLVGCWRDYEEDVDGATRITLPSGEEGLSWGVDPETGKELIGMLPHAELCFDAKGTVTSVAVGIDEGLGSSGPYTFDGQSIHVHDEYDFPDGWLFGDRDATCTVEIEENILTLGGCGGAWLAERRFSRTVGP